jgi:cytidylate kinase
VRNLIITIDGPAGSGKSTVAGEVARRLGFTYLDTGALYRAAALAVLGAGCDVNDADACADVIERSGIDIRQDGVFLDGRDVTGEIRSPEVGDAASAVAVHGRVRGLITRLQQRLAEKASIVVEGRDTGSVVFPNADLKIYLDAGIHERARRRQAELARKGLVLEGGSVLESLRRRDDRDVSRSHSPLVVPEHAVVVDTTHLSIEEVVGKILSIAEKALAD